MTGSVRAPVHESRLMAAAREHLPAPAVPLWRDLLLPAILLDHAAEGEPVAGHYGGDTVLLPPGMPWPEWDDYGPLTPWLTLDCAALPRTLPRTELALPESGLLQFFLADGQLWGKRTPWTIGSSAGAPEADQVVYVPDAADALPTKAPDALHCIEPEPLTAWLDLTPPQYPETAWRERYGDDAAPDALTKYEFEVETSGEHLPTKIGGHTYAMQDPPEDELVRYAVFKNENTDEERQKHETAQWRPLLEYSPHDRTALHCGDYWNLYWFIRADALAARRFDEALMVEQCT